MRKTILIVTAIVAFAAAALMPTVRADDIMVNGEVTKIDESAGKITIKHAPIKKFDMDAATMVFQAQDPTMLKQVKAGDKIRFHPDRVGGQLTVTKMVKAK